MRKIFFHILFLTCSLSAFAQLVPIVDSIPMRDGKKLAADIYIPSALTSGGPVILIQTPYNRQLYRYSLPLGVGLNLSSSNYVFVIVDWRGFYGSASAIVANPNRGQDGYDVVEWIATKTWSNGKIGTWGPSALGKIQFQTAKENPPHLTCIAPLVAAPQFDYSEYYPGGVYRTEYVQQLDNLGYGLSTFLLANPFFSNTWTYVQNQNFYPSSIKVPVFMVGGWYDHNVELMLSFLSAIQTSSDISVRSQHKLMMGPWAHGGFGTAQVGSCQQGELTFNEACHWSDSLVNKYFDAYLRNIDNNWSTEPTIRYFQIGENFWRQSEQWPVSGTQLIKLYFTENMTLQTQSPSSLSAFSTITYDPRNPSPTIGGPTLRNDLLQGPYDQAPLVESRNDVLVFSTPVLSQNVRLIGNSKIHLFVSSNRPDTDFAIRLTDVYPNGKSMFVADGIKRMRFRNGYRTSDTASMIAGNVYEVEIDLPNTATTFLAGHRIRVDVTSSNYPRFDRNLNNGGTMYVAGDTLIAENKVFHNATQSSYIEMKLESYPTEISENNNHKQYLIYPNPASDVIIIKSIQIPCKYEIFSVVGELVISGTLNSSDSKIDISMLKSGLYLIKTAFFTKKFIINK